MKFNQWYFQACGGILGVASCLYGYLSGDMLLYSNLIGNFDIINFGGIIASFLLYPLCILTFLLALCLSIQNANQKRILNIELEKINATVVYTTSVVGILGCTIYFIFPTLLLLSNKIASIFKYFILKYRIKHPKKNKTDKDLDESSKDIKSSEQLLSTKIEMAVNLLHKDADIHFITDVTGLSQDYVTKLKREEVNKK